MAIIATKFGDKINEVTKEARPYSEPPETAPVADHLREDLENTIGEFGFCGRLQKLVYAEYTFFQFIGLFPYLPEVMAKLLYLGLSLLLSQVPALWVSGNLA